MDELLTFLSEYGWQLSLIALAGIIILGILKYCGVFEKLSEGWRHFCYIAISAGLSIIGSAIYLACIGELTVSYLFLIAGAILALNQTFYSLYSNLSIKDFLANVVTWIKEKFQSGELEDAVQDVVDDITSSENPEEPEDPDDPVEPEIPEEPENPGEEEDPEEPEEPEEPEVTVTEVAIPVAVTGLIYNATEQIGVAATDAYTVENGSAVDAGEYTAKVELVDTVQYKWAEEDFNGEIVWEILKAQYDISNVSFANGVAVYDGTPHSLVISGDLPEGVTVEYEGNEAINAGRYQITANFIGDAVNYEDIDPKTATLIIRKAEPTVEILVDLNKILYTSMGLPDIELSDDSTAGTCSWVEGQELEEGTHTYQWKFVPDDTNNYNELDGEVELTAVEPVAQDAAYDLMFGGDPATIILPALGDVTVNLSGLDDGETYSISIAYAGPVVGAGAVLLFYYKVDGGYYLPSVDDYASEFDITYSEEAAQFTIHCTPGEYDYKTLLKRKWGSDNVELVGEFTDGNVYKMTITSAEGKIIEVALDQE